MAEPEYPESEKLKAGATERSTINDFLEWVREKHGAFLATEGLDMDGGPDRIYVLGKSSDDLAQEYLGVDPAKLETERRDMLDRLREMNS